MNSHRYCVIMCGGVGSRFWPFSRDKQPKQFLDFFGTGKSLLQLTVERISPLVDPAHILLVSNRRYAPLIAEQLPEIPAGNILLEPARRNTAPCICWAANHINALDPDASFVVLPADHLILQEKKFLEAVSRGFDFVEGGDRLLTLGITPSSPHTGYGYIQEGKKVDGREGINRVKSFTEKPGLELAQQFIESGEFLWNAGIFLWKTKSILKAFEKLASEIYQTLEAPENTYATPAETPFIEEAFPDCMNISVDYAIMEKADNVFVERVDFGWSDLGSWKSLHEASPRNIDGNVTQGCKVLTQDCKGSIFAVAGEKIIVASGLKDYIVADNGNALLICPISEEQRIRNIVNEVRERFGEDYV